MNNFQKTSFQGFFILLIIAFQSCSDDKEKTTDELKKAPAFIAAESDKTTYQEYPVSLEGKENVEVRSQTDGYIEKIFVDEGELVMAGQPLFRIQSKVYNEDFKQTKAEVTIAKANLEKARVEVERLEPLVTTKVISPVQLNTAKQEYEAAKGAVNQAEAVNKRAGIMLGFTLIKAPITGYVGNIPFKLGSLISKADNQALTTISNIQLIYAYFSMSEPDFFTFQNRYPGTTLEEKIKNLQEVELITANNSSHPLKGRIELVQGQFDKTIGAIKFRASFPNPGRLLRSGNTGRIRMGEKLERAIMIPKESTFELQDKSFVFVVADGNKVTAKAIDISGETTHYFYVTKGIKAGDRIIYQGTEVLSEGLKVDPTTFPIDSLLRIRPE